MSSRAGRLADFAQTDLAASGPIWVQGLGREPVGPDLLSDLRGADYGLAWRRPVRRVDALFRDGWRAHG